METTIQYAVMHGNDPVPVLITPRHYHAMAYVESLGEVVTPTHELRQKTPFIPAAQPGTITPAVADAYHALLAKKYSRVRWVGAVDDRGQPIAGTGKWIRLDKGKRDAA